MPTADRVAGARRALVIATGRYEHEAIANLQSPARDAEMIERVLRDPAVGAFDEVNAHVDIDKQRAFDTILDFFRGAKTDEFLFVYISCHGLVDDRQLYLAMSDTDPRRLPASGVSGDYIAGQFDSCRANKIVMVLDCCHAGAFTGPVRRTGRDRIIILTANETQLAHEGNTDYFPVRPSAFCGAFFEGIESGRADSDSNGVITVREAYSYAVDRLGGERIAQTPQMRVGTGAPDIVLCRAPVLAGSLPPEIASLVRHSLPAARLTAVEELGRWLSSPDGTKVTAAEYALNGLRGDPVERVAAMAGRLMAGRSPGERPRAHAELPAVNAAGDPHWYRSAVCYEIQVRTFADGNGDGIGDLAGVRGKLDYLRWLGVDCLVLSSVFESPWDDDGNDVSDFRDVHHDLGTVSDLVELIDAAHARGLRVLLDLVLNHTSTAHRWFDESRRNPDGPYGDYYVWRPMQELGADPVDSATGGWTLDPVRQQFYWHRFKRSEPDLNFDAEVVQDEMIDIARHWLRLGVDGFRLIGAPFLFERENEGGEGLDETHVYLARLRAAVDAQFPGRALLAWANRWPTDAVEYFGNEARGPECNVVLYASLIPRIFLGLRNQNHDAVSDVLDGARQPPEGCQWGLFLRNGDEMSLDTVAAEERQYLLDEYAPLPRMRTTEGIRRRLAPLLDNDRRLLELCMALLLSLPGSPTIYYGDEIGMGENLTLPGRDAMRAPMQWSGDRGGGFSTAEQDELTLPAMQSTTYGYQAVNVVAQRGNSSSLVNLVRRLIEVRKQSPALSGGGYQAVPSSNRAVMAYLRVAGADVKLCVANFSRYPQATRLDLTAFKGLEVVEVSGGARFGIVGGEPYPLMLAAHGYFWLGLVDER